MNLGFNHYSVKRLLSEIIMTGYLLTGINMSLSGQNAPVTTASVTGTVVPGQNITVNITVSDFIKIGSVSLSMDYDFSRLHYVSGTINSQLFNSGNYAIGDNDLGNGKHRLILGWYGGANSLPNGTILITYIFNYISGSSILSWFDDGSSCLYTTDTGAFLNDLPFQSYYHNGLVCGTLPDPGVIYGPVSVCCGSTGNVYSVNNITQATRYIWSVPSGAIINGDVNSNSVTIDFPFSTASGNVTVKPVNDCGPGAASIIPVTVTPAPFADAGADFTITAGNSASLTGSSGGSTGVSYYWTPANMFIDPNVKNPQTVVLSATSTFTLEVHDITTLCSVTDQVVVTVNAIVTDITDIQDQDNNRDISAGDILIFPNPATDHFTIRLINSALYIESYTITTKNGTQVRNSKTADCVNGSDIQVNTAGLTPGLYFICLKSPNKTFTKRVIIL